MKKCAIVDCQNSVEEGLELCSKCKCEWEKIIPQSQIEIENNFRYHAPKEGQPEKYEAIRNKGKELAQLIHDLCPNSREKSVAMTELETAIFWANASIARNE